MGPQEMEGSREMTRSEDMERSRSRNLQRELQAAKSQALVPVTRRPPQQHGPYPSTLSVPPSVYEQMTTLQQELRDARDLPERSNESRPPRHMRELQHLHKLSTIWFRIRRVVLLNKHLGSISWLVGLVSCPVFARVLGGHLSQAVSKPLWGWAHSSFSCANFMSYLEAAVCSLLRHLEFRNGIRREESQYDSCEVCAPRGHQWEVQLTDQDVAWVDKEIWKFEKSCEKVSRKKRQNDRYLCSLNDWLVCRQAFLQDWPFSLDGVSPDFDRDWMAQSSAWLQQYSAEELTMKADVFFLWCKM